MKEARFWHILRSRLLWILVHPAISFTVGWIVITISAISSNRAEAPVGVVATMFVPLFVHSAFFGALEFYLPKSVAFVFEYLRTAVGALLYYGAFAVFLVYIKKMSKRTLIVCSLLALAMILLTLKGCTSNLYFPSNETTQGVLAQESANYNTSMATALETTRQAVASGKVSDCDAILSISSSYAWRNDCAIYVKGKGEPGCQDIIIGDPSDLGPNACKQQVYAVSNESLCDELKDAPGMFEKNKCLANMVMIYVARTNDRSACDKLANIDGWNGDVEFCKNCEGNCLTGG